LKQTASEHGINMKFSIFANGELYESDFCNIREAVDRGEELSKDYEFLTIVENETRKIWWVSDCHVHTHLLEEKKDSV
jgi:hypothetical protein